ncbi:MAG TPA: tetratricopeptide repeat protein [Terracidiphilus sp.]|nr:tetratricopeptide repeat protein [Terracidiphilus sp.]
MKPRILHARFLAAAALAMILAPAAVPAHAASKEIIELQTQVQQLLDEVQRLQSTFDTKFGVLQNLAEQTADEANKMTSAVNALQQKMDAESQNSNGKLDTVSGQVQSLNDSVDELKTRIAKLDKSISDLQTQLQQLQSQPNPAAAPGAAPAPGTGAPAGENGAAPAPAMAAPQAQAPPLNETFQAALRDFNSGHYQLASTEFQDIVRYYPLDDLAGTSQFYLGEIAYQQQRFEDAINDYNAVLEGFSGNAKAPAAQLKKGLALLALSKREAGIHELRLLIQRHPQTPEAARARSKLNSMRVSISASR